MIKKNKKTEYILHFKLKMSLLYIQFFFIDLYPKGTNNNNFKASFSFSFFEFALHSISCCMLSP